MLPELLLLGGGYTLRYVAAALSPHRFVITCRSEEGLTRLLKKGYVARLVDCGNPRTIEAVLKEFPSLRTVVDSVPEHVNIEAVLRLFECASFARALYLSTSGTFGGLSGEEVHEKSTCTPFSPSARSRLCVEEQYLSSKLTVTCLRIAGIYGPGRGLSHALSHGTYCLVDGGSRWTNRIHVEDLARTIVSLLDYPNPPPVLCVSDDKPALAREVVSYYCHRFSLPYPGELTSEEARARGMYHYLSNQRICNSLLKRVIGAPLRYPTYCDGAQTEFAVCS